MRHANQGQSGPLRGKGLRIAIVQARFNADITDRLANACLAELAELGLPDDHIEHVQVPGALEVPVLLKALAESGDYDLQFTSSNVSLNASAQEYRPSGPMKPWTSAACPPSGLVVSIDGVYSANQPGYPVPLTAGQRMVIFVSAPTWAAVKTGVYTLTVKKR